MKSTAFYDVFTISNFQHDQACFLYNVFSNWQWKEKWKRNKIQILILIKISTKHKNPFFTEHIYSPLTPIWLMLYIKRGFEKKVCGDLEPSFRVKCKGHSRIIWKILVRIISSLPLAQSDPYLTHNVSRIKEYAVILNDVCS